MSQEQLAEAVFAALRRITRAMDRQSRAMMRRGGLTGPQVLVLRLLAGGEELSVGALAQQMSLSQATVTGIINRLELRGLMRRRRDQQDKRRVLVSATPAGQSLVEGAPSMWQDSFMNQLSQQADWERTLMLASLQRLAGMMETPDAIDVQDLPDNPQASQPPAASDQRSGMAAAG